MHMPPHQRPAPIPSQISLLDRLAAFFEVLAAALVGTLVVQMGLMLSGVEGARVFEEAGILFAVLTLEATVSLALIALLLRRRGENMKTLGWDAGQWRREAAVGLAFIPVLLAVMALVTLFFSYALPQYVSKTNPVMDLLQTRADVVFFLISSLYVGGIKEEIQRAFVLKRFERYLGGAALGLALWSAYFGFGHLVQGVDNAVKAAALGAVFGGLYLLRRNLTAPIVCHAVYDVFAVLAYWNWLGPGNS